jgi:hypothetical protein
MPLTWTGAGPTFRIAWGDRDWSLQLDAARPGLHADDTGPVLALAGVAAPGRPAPGALAAATLERFEQVRNRILAHYLLPDWGGMRVRAAWTPAPPHAIDLELEVSVRAQAPLAEIELMTGSWLAGSIGISTTPSARVVWPRDAHAARLSYDGREPDLHQIQTAAPGSNQLHQPWIAADPGRPESCYVELAHPDDESRRIASTHALRHAFFGHDLERGVVLRGRLRGLWLPCDGVEAAAATALDRFLHAPLPLETE